MPYASVFEGVESYRIELLKRFFPTLTQPSSCTRMDREFLFVTILGTEYLIYTETDSELHRELFCVGNPRTEWFVKIPLMANVNYEQWAMSRIEERIKEPA